MREKIRKLKKLCKEEAERYLNSVDFVAASSFMIGDLMEFPNTVVRRVIERRATEGNLFHKPYAGTQNLDRIEQIGVEAAQKLFGAGMASIQPHSGSQANQAAYFAFLNPGDKILSLKFDAGGHLTHGNPLNFSGRIYKFEYYGINPKTQLIDYDQIEIKTKKFKPKMIVTGASSYPREINYKKISEIARKNNSFFMVDIAHPVGLIATGVYPSPFPYADVVTASTEKTLGGPHGGIIMAKKEYEERINKAVHPGTQSSVPTERIARISFALLLAQTKTFKDYTSKVLEGAKVLENNFKTIPECLLFGGTDSHFVVINTFTPFGLTGKQAEKILENLNIFVNRQAIPWEKNKIFDFSGLRIGVPAAVGRGFTTEDIDQLSKIIITALKNPKDAKIQNQLKSQVAKIVKRHGKI